MTELETDQVTVIQIDEIEENIAYSIEVSESVSYSDDGVSMNKTFW